MYTTLDCGHYGEKPVYDPGPNPIFTALLGEFHRAGKTPVGKWHYTVRPSGTVTILSGNTSGIHSLYNQYYKRPIHNRNDWVIAHERGEI